MLVCVCLMVVKFRKMLQYHGKGSFRIISDYTLGNFSVVILNRPTPNLVLFITVPQREHRPYSISMNPEASNLS